MLQYPVNRSSFCIALEDTFKRITSTVDYFHIIFDKFKKCFYITFFIRINKDFIIWTSSLLHITLDSKSTVIHVFFCIFQSVKSWNSWSEIHIFCSLKNPINLTFCHIISDLIAPLRIQMLFKNNFFIKCKINPTSTQISIKWKFFQFHRNTAVCSSCIDK